MNNSEKIYDVIIAGSGMGSLSAAALLAKKGLNVLIIEQNYLPGGCTSSYWRKGFVFESGATTLVGLDKNQPLRFLLNEIGVELNAKKLDLPMQVRLKNGKTINRFEDINQWICEAERVFGKQNQKEFWLECFKISQFVWQTSLQQTRFPFGNLSDFLHSISKLNINQIKFLPYVFTSIAALIKKRKLNHNQEFIDFINAQLLITAQNNMHEVNALFGAASLCYTNYGNYYLDGGMIELINPILDYILSKNGEIIYKEKIENVDFHNDIYHIKTQKNEYKSRYFISGIPLNNTIEIYKNSKQNKFKNKILKSEKLNSAFQMGIGFWRKKEYQTIHYQLHLPKPLPYINAQTIFVSLSANTSTNRADIENQMVASVSTHWENLNLSIENFDKTIVENFIIDFLISENFFDRNDIIYTHASTPKDWEKWTGRKYGFVGGYPQFMKTKPWQMVEHRLDNHKAYIVGDSTYPGQGIPGVTLSGIIAANKLLADHF